MTDDAKSPLESHSIGMWLVLAAAVIAPRLAGLYTMSVFDDAFITFRHSAHLASGDGLVFNVGERILGTTSPLYALVLSGLAYVGIAPPIAAHVFGLTADVLTAFLGFSVLRRDVGIEAANAFVVLFALDPHIIRVAVGGMESSLFLTIALFVSWLLAKRQEGPALVLSCLAVYIRPEAAWLCAICFLSLWLTKGARRQATWTALAIVIAVLPLLAIWSSYGTPLPQSVASKGRRVGGSLGEVLLTFLMPEGSPIQSLLTVLALLGLPRALRGSPTVRRFMLFAIGYMAAYSFARPQMWTWYGLPIYGAKCLLAAVFLGSLLERIPTTARSKLRHPSWTLAVAGAGAIALVFAAGPSPISNKVYGPLREWCRANVRPTHSIAAGDVGAVGYYSDAFIYDLAGLVWKERWQYRSAREVLIARQPDFVFAEVSRYWAELFQPGSQLRTLYEPVRRFSRFGNEDLSPAPSDLAPGWVQDYVMFRRILPPNPPSETRRARETER